MKVQSRSSQGIVLFIVFLVSVMTFLVSVALCFLPAIVSSLIFRNMSRKINGPHEQWISFWAVHTQLFLYTAGAITLYKACVVNKTIMFSGVLDKLMKIGSWDSFIMIVLFGVIPSVIFYLIKVGDHFRDKNINNDIIYYVRANNKWLMMMLTSVVFNPIIFFYYGIRAKKVTWVVSGMVYVTPLIISLILFQYNYSATSMLFQGSILSQLLLWCVSIFHTYSIRREYLERIGSSNVVHVLREAA